MDEQQIWQAINKRAAVNVDVDKNDAAKYLKIYYEESAGWRNHIIDWATSITPERLTVPDGEVLVSRSSIRNIISHGKGPLKILTLPYLSELLKNAVLYHTENSIDKQGRQETFYNYAHPLIFENKIVYISISVKEDLNGSRVYDNEFAKATDGLTAVLGPSTRGILTHLSAISILKRIISVKPPHCQDKKSVLK